MSKKSRKPTGSLVERLEFWSARIAELSVRRQHARLMGHTKKAEELLSRQEYAERQREKIRKKLHAS